MRDLLQAGASLIVLISRNMMPIPHFHLTGGESDIGVVVVVYLGKCDLSIDGATCPVFFLRKRAEKLSNAMRIPLKYLLTATYDSHKVRTRGGSLYLVFAFFLKLSVKNAQKRHLGCWFNWC